MVRKFSVEMKIGEEEEKETVFVVSLVIVWSLFGEAIDENLLGFLVV